MYQITQYGTEESEKRHYRHTDIINNSLRAPLDSLLLDLWLFFDGVQRSLLVEGVVGGRHDDVLGVGEDDFVEDEVVGGGGVIGSTDGANDEDGKDPEHAKEDTNTTAKNEGHGATLPRAQRHQRAVDTLQESALVVLPVMHGSGMMVMVNPMSMVLLHFSLLGRSHRWPRPELHHDAMTMSFLLILLIGMVMLVRLVLIKADRRVERGARMMWNGRGDGRRIEVTRETHSTKHARDAVLHAGTEVANASGRSEAGLRLSSPHLRWAGVSGCMSETEGGHFGGRDQDSDGCSTGETSACHKQRETVQFHLKKK